MKKFLLTAIGIGIFAVSCGTKESTMSTGNRDSAAAEQARKAPATTDTMNTKQVPPDTIKTKIDSMAQTPVK
ncbi:cytochrome C551 [Chryseobacterium gallinarum]|uniref:Cytochrome C551 n=1 Tax=Chryseobacterium gallinarum TaxID=1324352 RepID=A0A0G3M083_CHRGL|nr:hypothetical protein [Chryseobacterium gallinarum]AKK71413.1 cytochrome C551 [Chryseobacterium gallinarum]MCL8538705.1 cytochrome C551 [Chryseobacterium gallinarum]